MRTWKNYLCMLAALVVTLGFTSCESDEDSCHARFHFL